MVACSSVTFEKSLVLNEKWHVKVLFNMGCFKFKLDNSDNHDDKTRHLEPQILEWEVKWTLRSIARNKINGSDIIAAELFQILKDAAVKMLPSICS